jgi:cysteinyl-tRNA synthetase
VANITDINDKIYAAANAAGTGSECRDVGGSLFCMVMRSVVAMRFLLWSAGSLSQGLYV